MMNCHRIDCCLENTRIHLSLMFGKKANLRLYRSPRVGKHWGLYMPYVKIFDLLYFQSRVGQLFPSTAFDSKKVRRRLSNTNRLFHMSSNPLLLITNLPTYHCSSYLTGLPDKKILTPQQRFYWNKSAIPKRDDFLFFQIFLEFNSIPSLIIITIDGVPQNQYLSLSRGVSLPETNKHCTFVPR